MKETGLRPCSNDPAEWANYLLGLLFQVKRERFPHHGLSTKTIDEYRKLQLGVPVHDKTPRQRSRPTAEALARIVIAVRSELGPTVLTDVEAERAVAGMAPRRNIESSNALVSDFWDSLRNIHWPKTLEDDLTRQIRERGEYTPGLLRWRPFWEEHGSARNSLAFQIMNDTMRAIFPGIIAGEPKTLAGLEDLTDSLLIPGNDAIDIAFGLFQTPSRERFARFCAVDGFAGYASILVLPGNRDEDEIWKDSYRGWSRLMTDRSEQFAEPVAVVLKDEIGYLQLCMADYKLKDEHTDMSLDGGNGAIGVISHKWSSQVQAELLADCRKKIDKNRNLFFVAEWHLVVETYRALQKKWNWSIPPTVVPFSQKWTPRFPLGLSVRADANRFGDLIDSAVHRVLFGSSISRTAHWYLRALEAAIEQKKSWQEILPQIPHPPIWNSQWRRGRTGRYWYLCDAIWRQAKDLGKAANLADWLAKNDHSSRFEDGDLQPLYSFPREADVKAGLRKFHET